MGSVNGKTRVRIVIVTTDLHADVDHSVIDLAMGWATDAVNEAPFVPDTVTVEAVDD